MSVEEPHMPISSQPSSTDLPTLPAASRPVPPWRNGGTRFRLAFRAPAAAAVLRVILNRLVLRLRVDRRGEIADA